ncbi:solute carrier family 22 member 6-like isoform X3 [Plodia interpunctella]|uniref:solute carrier family 22 member 6-like isoform X3 n=1 Tax=Plodia interpunctella TaxID=58824 RepID=UPI0023689354|nr:solute carrier family 22 member 6-like isoform X3 [Plodia interpunctella]
MEPTVLPLDAALDRVGFGLYSCMLLVLTGMIIISFSFVVYSNTVLIPLSSCELNTNIAQRGLMAAMPSLGSIVGAIFWGYLGDTKGRRKMLLISLLLGAGLNALSSISLNWIMLIVIQSVSSVLVSGQYPLSMTLLSECVPLDKRNLVLILVTSIFLFSQGLMAVIAIPIAPLGFSYYMPFLGIHWTPWRAIALVYSIPSVVSLVWLFFMQDSPKFVLENDQAERALKILQSIYKVNNLGSKKTLEVAAVVRKRQSEMVNQKLSLLEKLKPFIRPPLRRKIIIITTLYAFQFMWPFKVWLPTIANQMMSIIETGKGSDLTLCRIIRLSFKDPSSDFLNRVGRRNMVIMITSFCGISGIFVNIMPHAITSFLLFTIQLIGMICMGYYTAIAVSVFPTAYRAMGVTIAVTGNRISMFFAIQILNYMLKHFCEVGFFIFCILFTSSSLITLLLPDDRISMTPRTSIVHSVFGLKPPNNN